MSSPPRLEQSSSFLVGARQPLRPPAEEDDSIRSPPPGALLARSSAGACHVVWRGVGNDLNNVLHKYMVGPSYLLL